MGKERDEVGVPCTDPGGKSDVRARPVSVKVVRRGWIPGMLPINWK